MNKRQLFDEQSSLTFLEKFNGAIPTAHHSVLDRLPEPGIPVSLTCKSELGGPVRYPAFRHPIVEGYPWYVFRDECYVKIGNETPLEWLPYASPCK